MNNFNINMRKTKVDELKIFACAVNICIWNAKFSRKRAFVRSEYIFLKTLASLQIFSTNVGVQVISSDIVSLKGLSQGMDSSFLDINRPN